MRLVSRLRWQLVLYGCLAVASQAASARPASYVPDQQWNKKAWRCREGAASFIEVAHDRPAISTVADLRISGLQMDGKPVRPQSVDGLEEFVANLGAIESISGRCGWTGEFIFIRGFVRQGPDLRVTQEKEFFVPYRR